jgi:hypothetical protein
MGRFRTCLSIEQSAYRILRQLDQEVIRKYIQPIESGRLSREDLNIVYNNRDNAWQFKGDPDRAIADNNTADDTNRIEREERYAGGKGIDVSKVLITLGVENKDRGLIGGFIREELEGLSVNDEINCDFIGIANETYTNIIVNEINTEGKNYG